MTALGVHSEIGRLREVLVHRPDLSLQRLTPDNCNALLFDDVLWVKRARQEHDVFVDALRERGVRCIGSANCLRETMAMPRGPRMAARSSRRSLESSGYDMVDEMRGWLDEMPADELADVSGRRHRPRRTALPAGRA